MRTFSRALARSDLPRVAAAALALALLALFAAFVLAWSTVTPGLSAVVAAIAAAAIAGAGILYAWRQPGA
jgi:hypothetical protein